MGNKRDFSLHSQLALTLSPDLEPYLSYLSFLFDPFRKRRRKNQKKCPLDFFRGGCFDLIGRCFEIGSIIFQGLVLGRILSGRRAEREAE